jgi:hypothetical protein
MQARANDAKLSFFLLLTPLLIGFAVPQLIWFGELEQYIGDAWAAPCRNPGLHVLLSVYSGFNLIFRHHVKWGADIPVFTSELLIPFATKLFYLGILVGELLVYANIHMDK